MNENDGKNLKIPDRGGYTIEFTATPEDAERFKKDLEKLATS